MAGAVQQAVSRLSRPAGALPRLGGDRTLSLLRNGYRFIPETCDALGSDGFRTRLMLRDVICLRGAEAAALFYGAAGVTRRGAMPQTVLRLLQDRHSVQQADAATHLKRKAMFLRILMAPEAADGLVSEFRSAFRAALSQWAAQGEVVLIDAVNPVLTRAVCAWVGLPVAERRLQPLAATLFGMSDRAGSFGPGTWIELARRNRLERWLRGLAHDIRRGRATARAGSPLDRVLRHTESDGRRLTEAEAAVELLNILRPVVAVGRYIAFAALHLHRNPVWARRFAQGDLGMLLPFVEEVRRISPFFPFVGAVATEPLAWRGHPIARGQWMLLDLYGTTHDHRSFPEPEAFDPERGLSWEGGDPAFIPQGGGDAALTHRCPGERITVALMAEAVRLLCAEMCYDIPPQALDVRLNRIPARPQSGLRLSGIRAAQGAAAPGQGAPVAGFSG